MNIQQLIAYPQGTTEPITYPTGEVVLDLFKDEPIPLVLNVDDFTNVAEADASYSKSFEIPGTKKNNLFFNHIYDITSDSNFNPHKKTKIIVKEGSIDTFNGYLQLNEIIKKDGVITYDINLYDNVVNLKSILQERLFRDLDLSELDHAYTENNIKDSWTGNLTLDNTLPANSFAGTGTTTDVVKYPLVRWNTNSSYNAATSQIFAPIKNDLFRAWVNLKYIFLNIFRDAGYSITSAFFNNTDFSKLYIDFNKGWGIATFDLGQFKCSNTSDITYLSQANVDFNVISNTYNIVGSNYYDTTTDVFTCVDTSQVEIYTYLNVTNTSGANATLRLYKNGSLFYAFVNNMPVNTGSSLNFNTTVFGLVAGDTLEVKISASSSIDLDSTSSIDFKVAPTTSFMNDTLSGYRGDVNQWDFIKDIRDIFDFVIIADDGNPNNLIIEPYKDWVDSGSLVDLTKKVDDTDVKYSPIDGLSKRLNFKFKEDTDDRITKAHNTPNDWRYSHKQVNDIELFDKKEDILQLNEIAATYYAPILNGNISAPIILDNDFNDNWENKIRLLYDNGVTNLPTDTIISYQFSSTSYLSFSSKEDVVNGQSYNYGVVNYDFSSTWINSLFNTYWLRYIDELYHKDTRFVKILAYLNSEDISKIKFNDIILIKNKKYRLSKIEYRAGAMSKLELINIKDL